MTLKTFIGWHLIRKGTALGAYIKQNTASQNTVLQ